MSGSRSQLTRNGVFAAVMLRRFIGIPWSGGGEHVEPAQDDHDGKHPPQNPSLFEECEHGILSSSVAAGHAHGFLTRTIYHIVYRSTIDFFRSHLSNFLIGLWGGPTLHIRGSDLSRDKTPHMYLSI